MRLLLLCAGIILAGCNRGHPPIAKPPGEVPVKRDAAPARPPASPADAGLDSKIIAPATRGPVAAPFESRSCKAAGTICVRASQSIAAAVKAAKDGTVVMVAAGTFRENILVANKSIQLLGGYSADFKRRGEKTAIHGIGGNAVIELRQARNSVVEGFTIRGGTGNERQRKYYILGGGIYVTGGSPRIAYNRIVANDVVTARPKRAAENLGGAIFAEDCRIDIHHNIVRNNRAGRGAIAVTGPEAKIRHNWVEGNLAIGDHGGGIYAAGKKLLIEHNQVLRNSVLAKQGSWGGGIMVYDRQTRAVLRYNRVSENSATDKGSGVFVDDGAQAILNHERYWANRCAPGGGSGLYVDGLNKTGSRVAGHHIEIRGHACPGKGHAIYVEGRSRVALKAVTLKDNGISPTYRDSSSSLTVSP